MSTDAPSSEASALSPRAGIALLTLQLRTSLQEAATLEAAESTIDEAAARAQLRERLDPLIEERRRGLDEAVAGERAAAAEAVAAARRRANELIADARAAELAAREAVVEDTIEPEVVAPEVVEPGVAESEVIVDVDARDRAEPPPQPEVLPPPTTPRVVMRPSRERAPQQINVVLDAEAFARAFATMFSALLDERIADARANPLSRPPIALPPVIVQAPAPPSVPDSPARASFWMHARHPDVFLMGLAMVIVLVVLVAWMA